MTKPKQKETEALAEQVEKMIEILETEQIVFYMTKDGKDHVTLPPNPMFMRTSNVINHGKVERIWARVDAKKREAEKIGSYVA